MTEALRVQGLCKAFGALEVLKGIDLVVERGQTVVLLGASGSGKSTLLRCLNFLEMADAGQIALHGQVVGREDGERALCAVRSRVGMVFQQFNLFPHMTALQNVMEGQVTVLRRPRVQARARAMALLGKVGLAEKADAYPSRLSGGQQQRVAIARALALDPEIMLFDEVTSALDPELVGEVLRAIRALRDEGMTMVIVTHELGFAYHVADHVVFLHEGAVYEEGPPDAVLLNPQRERTRMFLEGHNMFRLPS